MRLARKWKESMGLYPVEAIMRRKSSQAGFTLVELLVAVAIMAVGLLGLAQLQVTAIQTNAHSSGLVAANALAQSAIEDIVGRSPDSALFSTQVLQSANAALPGYENVQITGAGTYRVQYWTVPNYQPNLCQVWIRVQSVSGTQRPQSVTMTTLKRWRSGGA